MNFKKYETKEKFMEENFPLLLQNEAENEVMISIVKQHHEAKVSKWLLGRIEDAEKVKIIFIVDDDKEGLVVYFPEVEIEKKYIDFLVDKIIDLNVDLKEILAPVEYANQISNSYIEKTGKSIRKISNTYTYKLEELNEECVLAENEKIIKLEDEQNKMEELIKIVKEIHTDIYNLEECSDKEAMKTAKIYLKKGIYLLTNETEDEIYTQVVNVRKQINGVAIGAVITPKKFRGKGYAKKCIYGVCKRLLEEGNSFVVLHVATKNEAAIKVYERIGFKKIDEVQRIMF